MAPEAFYRLAREMQMDQEQGRALQLKRRSKSPQANRPGACRCLGWVTGLEPAAFGATVRRSNQLSYTHRVMAGTPGGIRTPDLEIRSLLLYPAELRAHIRSDPRCRVRTVPFASHLCQSVTIAATVKQHGAADGTRTRNSQLGRLRLYQLNYRRTWSGRPDSNRRPPAPKAGALPNCATARPYTLCGMPSAGLLPEGKGQYRFPLDAGQTHGAED